MATEDEPASADEPDTPPPREQAQRDQRRDDDEAVDEMERESFPASDPPSTWAGRPAAG
jgi:hypothetical protein